MTYDQRQYRTAFWVRFPNRFSARAASNVNILLLQPTASSSEYGTDYDRLRPLAYPRTDVFALAYDPLVPESVELLETKWKPELSHHMPNTPILVVALSSPTSSGSGPTVPEAVGRDLARKIEADGFLSVDSTEANEARCSLWPPFRWQVR